MENILKIIYDKSINNQILNLKDIEKILELLVVDKSLHDYILNINVQHIRSNNLASYSSYSKKITIYVDKIEQMISNIEQNILSINDFEITLYKNLSILQILLHEVEHAHQQKIAYNEDSLEAFILRLSFLVQEDNDESLYEYCPEERLAEIKSFEEIAVLISWLNDDLFTLNEILDTERLKRLLRGYHYKNSSVNIPIVDYFTLGNKSSIINSLDLSISSQKQYALNERFRYGFPISIKEYGMAMKTLVKSLNQNFKNNISIKI